MILKNQIEQVVEEQFRWLIKIRKEVHREEVDSLLAREGFATIVTGLRRCGKSTLMRQVMHKYDRKDVFFINFEDIHLTGFDAEDLSRLHSIIVERGPKVLFFDEIQIVERWEIFIHQLLREDFLIYITGSNASMLSMELGTHLTGRHISSELFSFSYAEYLKFNNLLQNDDSFVRYLNEGGMPEYLATRDKRVPLTMVDDILMRDIAMRHNIRNVEPLKLLTVYLLTNISKPFTANRLTSIVGGVSTSTLIDYVDYMRDAYLIDTIGQYSTSMRTTIRNPKKVYAFDTGIARCMTLSQSADVGRLLENYQFLVLRKKHRGHIFYYRGKGECDFVVTDENNQPRELYQVCMNLNGENMEREIGGLREAMRVLHINEGKIITLSGEDVLHVDEGVIRMVSPMR